MKTKYILLGIFILLNFTRAESQVKPLKDIRIGPTNSNPYALVVCNNKLFFTADDGIHGIELWVSDGTTKGTFMLKDIYPGSISMSLGPFVAFNNNLFFVANDKVLGRELWKSDGTPEGTQMVMDLSQGNFNGIPDQSSLVATRDELTFVGSNGSPYYQLWSSDGTEPGTKQITNFTDQTGYIIKLIAKLKDTYLFTRKMNFIQTELWLSDGTEHGTFSISDTADKHLLSYSDKHVQLDSILIFSARDSAHGDEIWRSDGTLNGTYILKDIAQDDLNSTPNLLTLHQNKVFFVTTDLNWNYTLWETDGSKLGTKEVFKFNANTYVRAIYSLLGKLYFVIDDPAVFGREIWYLEGGKLSLLKDICKGNNSSEPESLIQIDSLIYFAARDETGWNSIWTSNGTREGTQIYHKMNDVQGLGSKLLTNYKNHLYFTGFNFSTGQEVFTDDPHISSISNVNSSLGIEIYPNPVVDVLHIDFSKLNPSGFASEIKIQVFNVHGQIMIDSELPMDLNEIEIDIRSLSKGIYTIVFQTENSIFSQKLLKE
ncbi:MAG: T9SS type A sorting domain-containing protein [Bacteroidia bacterium]